MAGGADRGQDERPRFSRVLARASTNAVNLIVAGAGAVAAAATGSWAVLALGGAAYAAMVGLDAANPRTWKRMMAARGKGRGLPGRAQAELPAERDIADAGIRDAVRALRAAQSELTRVLADTPSDVSIHLSDALVSLGELQARAVSLVHRANALCRFLAGVDAGSVRAEIAQLERRIAATADAQARAQFESARESHREHLKAIEDITGAKERVEANLHQIVAVLSALPAKLMRMSALDDQAMDELGGNVGEELDRINADIRAFEETLRTVTETVAS